MNTKYKGNQKVRVRKDLVVGVAYPMEYQEKYDADVYFYEEMEKYKGKIVTISGFSDDSYYISEGFGRFTDAMLEPVTNYTKADLKDGMVVEFRNGERRLVFDGKLMNLTDGTGLAFLNDNLEFKGVTDMYVNKVYKTLNCYCLAHYFDDEHLRLIWERNN